MASRILVIVALSGALGGNMHLRAQSPTAEASPPSDTGVSVNWPEGSVEGPHRIKSQVFPGTERDYWLYVSSQYSPDKPACLLVVQDGLELARQWRLPEALDQLIAAGEMPVTLAIFVNPGVIPASKPDVQPRFNRSVEYDSLGETYARFLLEELIPEVASRYNLSADPNHRAIAGASSGGTCAFNVAWERPDAFRRVLSTIGSFVGLRGAHEFPVLIRKFEPKPLRVFLQDGNADLNIYAGDWWLANQAMLSALQWSGYDVQHTWIEDAGHDSKSAAAIMPDALRWLWRGFPEPIRVGSHPPAARGADILIPGADWQQISSGHESVDATTCNAAGVVFFSDSRAGRIYRMGDDNKTRVFKEFPSRVSAMRFGPDEKLYLVKENRQIVRIDEQGTEEVVVADQRSHRLVTLPQGFYFSDDVQNKIYWCSYAGAVKEAFNLSERPAAMLPAADQASMHVALAGQQSTLQFTIADDFSLVHRQRFGHLHLPYLETSSGVTAMVTDDQGRVYVATSLGIQVLDQLGRVQLILSKPSRAPVSGMVIAGPFRDMLYASDGQTVFARKLKIKGVDSYAAPVALPRPRL